jgi:hypothetical protein
MHVSYDSCSVLEYMMEQWGSIRACIVSAAHLSFLGALYQGLWRLCNRFLRVPGTFAICTIVLAVSNCRIAEQSNIMNSGFTYDRLHAGIECLAIPRCYCKHNGLRLHGVVLASD